MSRVIQSAGEVPTSKHAAHRLFIPGPTDVHPAVLAAQTEPMIGHRSEEFESLFATCQSFLRRLFYTRSRVYVVASSGSGLQEAAIRNSVSGTVLNFVNGAFSERWHRVALGCSVDAHRIDIPWGSAVYGADVERALDGHRGPVDAITIVHNETSTGVMSPIEEIARVVRQRSSETLLLVDAVSSLSGAPIDFDDWGLDLCLTSSQKALALPPGLAFAAVSDRLLERAQEIEGRGWYFDFLLLEQYLQRGTTPATPAISLMRALQVQLERIFAEGLEARYARHRTCAEITWAWAESHGLSIPVERDVRSHTVTQIDGKPGFDISDFITYLKQRDLIISNGYGKYKNQAFRIGHMGELSPDDMQRLFATADRYFEQR